MAKRPELLEASDATIEDAVEHADPLVLRGLLYQLTGDEGLGSVWVGRFPGRVHAGGGGDGSGGRGDDPVQGGRVPQVLPRQRRRRYPDRAGRPAAPEHVTGGRYRCAGGRAGDVVGGAGGRSVGSFAGLDGAAGPRGPGELLGRGDRGRHGGLNAAVQLKHRASLSPCWRRTRAWAAPWYENRYPGARGSTRPAATTPTPMAWTSSIPTRSAHKARTRSISTGWPTSSTCARTSSSTPRSRR